jgi:hypothetical protein
MKKILSILIILSFVSCKEIIRDAFKDSGTTENISDKDLNTVNVDTKFSMTIPKYMKVMNTLNDEATLQYANIYKELYTVVMVEDKAEFVEFYKDYSEYDNNKSLIENYGKARLKSFKESMKVLKTKHYGLTKINGNNANQFTLKGNIDNIDVAYLFTSVETEKDIYFIMSWTLLDRYKRYENILEVINGSFKAISK